MKFLINELRTSLTQDITVSERTHIYSISLSMLKVGITTGNLTLSITVGSDIIFTSTVTMAELIADGTITADNNFHGFINFVGAAVLEAGTYTLNLVGDNGYSFSQSAFWGWRIDHEDELYFNEETSNDATKPLKLKVFDYEY